MLVSAAAVLFSRMPAVDTARLLQSFDVPALFAFGDSFTDVGINNYLPQATFKADFPPYGKTFFRRPTGRFSNGRLIVDFLAEALGLPFAPPFLQPNASFTEGVNFASAASGLLDSTNEGIVDPMSVQVQQFGTAKSVLQQQLGVETANTLVSKSIFFITSGSNDLSVYLGNTTLQQEINATDFLASAISKYQKTLLALYNGGARKVVVVGLGLIGCAPGARANNPAQPGECVMVENQLALAFNAALRQLVDGLRAAYTEFNIVIGYTSDTFSAIIADGASYGLTNVTSACCGAGFLNAQVQCGKPVPADLPNAVADFCERPSKSLFWDYYHPSEVVVRILFNLIFTGNTTYAYPINVKALAEL